AEALFLHKLNCDIGLIYSCQDVGDLLLQQGKTDEAREAYLRLCSNEETRSCEDVAKLATSDSLRNQLRTACDGLQSGACLAYSMTLQKFARTLLLDRCLKGDPRQKATGAICLEAARLIEVPIDVAAYVG